MLYKNYIHFCIHFKLNWSFHLKVVFLWSIFSLHSSTNLSTNLFLHLQIFSNITWFIGFTFTTAMLQIKSLITYFFVNQFFAFASAFIFIPSLFIVTNTSGYTIPGIRITPGRTLHSWLFIEKHFSALQLKMTLQQQTFLINRNIFYIKYQIILFH